MKIKKSNLTYLEHVSPNLQAATLLKNGQGGLPGLVSEPILSSAGSSVPYNYKNTNIIITV